MEKSNLEIYNIQKETIDSESIMNNRANIRCLLGSRSEENQEKVQKEKNEKVRLATIEAEKKTKIDRQEEVKMSRYYGKISGLES